MYNIYLLRHGRSRADDEDKFEGRYDSPLTDIGKEQARKTALYFKKNNVEFDKVLTSPLSRAKETAQIISSSNPAPIVEEPLLLEKDNGILAGLSKKEGDLKYPLPDFISPFRYQPENSGENLIELHSRAGLALSKIMNNNPGCFLIVSHGGLLNALVRNILGMSHPVDKSGHTFYFLDNGLLHLRYFKESHSWGICSFNHNLEAF